MKRKLRVADDINSLLPGDTADVGGNLMQYVHQTTTIMKHSEYTGEIERFFWEVSNGKPITATRHVASAASCFVKAYAAIDYARVSAEFVAIRLLSSSDINAAADGTSVVVVKGNNRVKLSAVDAMRVMERGDTDTVDEFVDAVKALGKTKDEGEEE